MWKEAKKGNVTLLDSCCVYVTAFQVNSKESSSWVCPKSQVCPPFHVLAAMGVMKPATFEKGWQTLPRQRKTTHSEVVSFCQPLGRAAGMLWWPQLLQVFLRVSTRQESSALKLWTALGSGMNPGAFCSTPGARGWEWALCALLRALSSLKLRGFFVYSKILLHTSLASSAFGTVLSFHNYFHRMGSFKLNSIKFREKINVRAFFLLVPWESTGLGLIPQHSSWLYEKSALSLWILCFYLAYQLHCFSPSPALLSTAREAELNEHWRDASLKEENEKQHSSLSHFFPWKREQHIQYWEIRQEIPTSLWVMTQARQKGNGCFTESKVHRNCICRNSRKVWKVVWAWPELVNRQVG